MTQKNNRLQETSFLSASQESVVDYLDVESIENEEDRCKSCLARMPYATSIATIMCFVGVIIFSITMHRGTTLAVSMFDQVMHLQLLWFNTAKTVFIIFAALMASLGLMILTVGFLTTGATREKVYKAWRTRVGGRVACGIFIVVTYILTIVWIVMLTALVVGSFVFTVFWYLCDNEKVQKLETCINLVDFAFFFPEGTKHDDLQICGQQEIKLFCKDYVEKAEIMFIVAVAACILVILSLVHYLMCLSANYAHIRDHSKFQELQDLQFLTDHHTRSQTYDTGTRY